MTNLVTKQTNFEEDRKLEVRHSWLIKGALGKFFFKADENMDLHEATDFTIFSLNGLQVASRLRRYKYFSKYKDQFTIRWSRPSGVETEIDKIRAGNADYIIYGFLDKQERFLVQYFIGDLRVFRDIDPEPIEIKPNHPFDSELAVYRLNQFPDEFVLNFWQTSNIKRLRGDTQ